MAWCIYLFVLLFSVLCGSITIGFFAKEGVNCNLIATKENVLQPVKVFFEQGLDQKFRQPSGTGIDFSMFEDKELKEESPEGVYPLMVKAEVCPLNNDELEANSTGNAQITLAVFDKKMNDKYLARVMKQILWVNSTRYELQEIYGIGNSVEVESDENDSGKECVICLSEPRDTTVLPCRHMVNRNTNTLFSKIHVPFIYKKITIFSIDDILDNEDTNIS